MSDKGQDVLSLQGLSPYVSLVSKKKHRRRSKNYNYSLICWNKITTIFRGF